MWKWLKKNPNIFGFPSILGVYLSAMIISLNFNEFRTRTKFSSGNLHRQAAIQFRSLEARAAIAKHIKLGQ